MTLFQKITLLTPVPAVTSLGLCSTSDVINFDQNWHHLYSNSAGGRDIPNDIQIRVTAQWSPKYTRKCSEIWVKTQSKLACDCTLLLHGKNCPSLCCFLRSISTGIKPSRRSITASKRYEKEKNERRKKKSLRHTRKFWFLRMLEQKCHKARCWWKQRQAVMLQMPF